MGVGFGVAGFVAVVVGEAVGEHEEKAVGCAGVGLQQFPRVADGRAQAGVSRGLELIELRPTARAEALPEGFESQEVDGRPATGTEPIDGDAVPELLKGEGEGGSGPPLVLMDGQTLGVGLAGRPRSVEQDEHAEVARELAPFQIDVLGRWSDRPAGPRPSQLGHRRRCHRRRDGGG